MKAHNGGQPGAFFGAVTVGERGQVVIPAEARKRQHIEHGDKLLVFGHPHGLGLFVLKASDMETMVSTLQEMLRADSVPAEAE